ncbi:hypothetical protein ANN_00122 [Periplaneta americana]|uniref:Reverse transcriptase n=1 Tax=Periplaneta americana TaxID=6978 RepID=A0ABQ8TRI6_PERAM|nr:hypothetical protein ANN_00122 [Periplaneta americana]
MLSYTADYSQYNGNQGSRQTNANSNNQQPAYRGQSPYKQAPQAPPQEPQRNAAYAQPSYNNQQDVYVQNIDPQEYNENYNTAWPEKQPPDRHTITTWHRKLLETGSLVEKTPRGKKVTEAQVDRIQQAFQQSPCQSVRRASRELAIPKSTIHDVLHKSDMLLKIDIENGYLQKVEFSDEYTFHVCGIVNRHNCRIWGSENPHVVRELERDNPKINTDDQAQYNQQAAARQPNKSPTRSDRNELNFAPQTSSTTSTTIPPTTTITTTTTTLRTTTAPSTTTTTTTVVPPRQQTRLREDPTTTTNTNKYNAVLAAIATSSPNERPSVRTTTTHFPSIPDFDTPYLLTLQDSTAQPSSRQTSTTLTNTVSRQRDTQQPKSRRITLTSAISLDDPFSTAAKSNQPSRSRGSPQRISIDLSTETATGRRGSEVISLSAPLSGTSRANPPSRGQEGNARRTATKSFTVIDNTDSNNKAFSLDAEIKAIENSFAQNSGQRRGEERSRGSSSRSDSTRTQNQRGSVEPVQRARLVSDTAASPNNVRAPQDSSSSRNPATPPRTPQARQPETPSPRSAPEVTTRSSPRTASNEIVSSPSIRISSTSRGSEAQKEPPPTSSPSALRSSYRASLVEPDDVHSGLSRNSIVQQSDVPTNARTRSRGGSQRKPTSCADAVDSNSNTGCDEKPQIRHGHGQLFHSPKAVRAILGRTLSTTRCRHPDCSELEPLGHVLGQCPKGELLINARHHRVRHALAILLKTLNWEIHEEVHCVSSDGSFRRADIIAINGRLKRALVLDPTIRFERNLNQATEVDIEKKSIYEPCLPYLSQKFNVPLKQWSVIGLLFGSRGENTQTIRENTEILLEASGAIGLEVNPEKTKYMIMSRDQNIVRNGNIKIGDLSFEEVEKFKYLGATVTNINDTREEIKRRINMGNACYYSIEKLLSTSLLSKNLKVRIYKTVILPVLLYGCETWTLTLREEHRFRVFENKVLRKIFGAKRDEVTGEWRKLHNTELHALYSSPDIIRNIKSRRLRWAGHVARMGESRNAYRVLVGRPEGKRPLGRPRRRWEDNIKMDLREVGYDDRDWINLAQDRDRWRAYVRAAMNLRVP